MASGQSEAGAGRSGRRWRRGLALLLGAVSLSAWSCSSGKMQENSGGGETISALNAAAACSALSGFKKVNSEAAVSASDALSAQYRALLLECLGQDPQKHLSAVQTALSKNPTLSSKLTGAQTHAWQSIATASLGHAKLAWDSERKTPSRVEPYVQFRGKNGAAARADFDARLFGAIKSTLGYRSGDSLVVVDQREYENKSHDTATETTRVARYRYERRHAGLKVFGDYLDIALRTSDWDKSAWFAFVNARWARDLPVSLAPKKTSNVAINAALVSGEVSGGTSVFPPELGICDLKPPAKLCYRLELNNTAGDHWGYFVDADSGAILEKGDRIKHQHSGSLKTYVGRPHEGNSKYLRPIPRLDIYEDPKLYQQEAACYWPTPAIDRTRGDETRKLTNATDYATGSYSNLVGIDPNDTVWTADFRGPAVEDGSPQSDLTVGSFLAGTNVTVAQTTTNARSRRAEAYYLLNYGSTVYSAANVEQFWPVKFAVKIQTYAEPGCQNPTDWDDAHACCPTGTLGSGGCVAIHCSSDIGVSAHPAVERFFRQTILREQGHSIQEKAKGSAWGTCPLPAIESLADFMAFATTQFEFKVPDDYLPNRMYPQDTGNYQNAWLSIYEDLLKRVGVVNSVYRTHDYLYAWNSSTKMLGTCTDQNSDGYLTPVPDCPSNSFYLHILNADTSGYSGIARAQYEISEVHHAHITDADPDASGIQPVPWADELPNPHTLPPFVDLEHNWQNWVSGGPETTSPALAFQYTGDHDAVLVLARESKTYQFKTTNLTSGTDTILEVVDRISGQVLASNDDCTPGQGLHSCINFTPSATGYYVVRARPYPTSSVGPAQKYTMYFNVNDDFGDDAESASSLAPDGALKSGYFETTSDQDVFRLVSGDNQTLSFLACSSNFDVQGELQDEGGNTLATLTSGDCSDSPAQVSVSEGTYYLIASPDSAATGTYAVKATLTEDIDQGTAQAAWQLPEEDAGYVLATRLETAGDEDWYQYNVSVSGRYLIFEVLNATTTPEIEVYAPASTVYGRTNTIDSIPDTSGGAGLGHYMLKKSDNAFGTGSARMAVMTVYPGTYYFRVRSTTNSAGSYSVMFDDTGLNGGWSQLPFPE